MWGTQVTARSRGKAGQSARKGNGERGRGRTQGGWQGSEDQRVGVLQEADPLEAGLLPPPRQARGVQQRMDVAVPVRFSLNLEGVSLLQRQMSFRVQQTGHLCSPPAP